MTDPGSVTSPAVRMVVCADGRPCRIRCVFAPVLTDRESPEIACATLLERDRNCRQRPHRLVEYASTPRTVSDVHEAPALWVFTHADGDACRWRSVGAAIEFTGCASDAESIARVLDLSAECRGSIHRIKRVRNLS